MIIPLLDLETRRKILFVDDYFTIRSIGTDSVLVTLGQARATPKAIENVKSFLRSLTQSKTISSIIIDISQAKNLALFEMLLLSEVTGERLQRFAMLSKKFRLRILFPFLRPYIANAQFKLFKDLASAIAWAKAC